ncbi:MAG: hypothetical protein HYR85_07595 [Planctomycetes bacterium]|nr:hypothetical protein [Planctomycetota bacterium]
MKEAPTSGEGIAVRFSIDLHSTFRRLVRFLAVVAIAASTPRTAAADNIVIPIPGGDLSITPPDFPELKRQDTGDDQLKTWWTGKIGASDTTIEVRVFKKADYWINDPVDMTAFTRDHYSTASRGGDPAFDWESEELIKGPFGWAPFASLVAGKIPNSASAKGELIVLGGVFESHAYAIEITSKPALVAADRSKAMEWLHKGVVAHCKSYDPNWTAEEIRARWEKDVADPKVRAALEKPIRTKHYLILTNSAAGSLFAKKMEEAYSKVQKTFPFPEVEGRRLMPVFVFRTATQYFDFYTNVSKRPRAEAEESKGHAWKDYYATFYDAANDPVHIHEGTHQIFANRLGLEGGGSWFQEGVAEYMCTSPNDRKGFARNAARQGKFVPFKEFVVIKELASSGGADAFSQYSQAASIIQFLHDSKWQPHKFATFLHEMGKLRKEDVASIEGVIQSVYGVDLDGLEKEWVKYWSNF